MKLKAPFNSLQFRFAIMTILVSVLILSFAVSSFLKLSNAQRLTSEHLQTRHQFIQSTSAINTQLVEAYNSINLFLLNPTNQEYLENINNNVDQALKQFELIIKEQNLLSPGELNEIITIKNSLLELEQDIKKLIRVRTVPTEQYPSMAIGNDMMAPNRNKANNSFIIIFNELEVENAIATKPQVYRQIVQLRQLWTQMLSNFRLYLANRVGSFNEAALSVQEKGIDTLYEQFNKNYDTTIKLDDQDLLGFETLAALSDLRDAATNWYTGFEKAKQINRSKMWRMDSVIMQHTIIPSFENIYSDLERIETRFDQSVELDTKNISNLSRQSAWIMLIVAAFAIVFVIALVLLTQHFVFNPIVTVSRAMKAQALGKQGHELPMSKIRETRGLIDAFNEMYRLINIRQTELEYRAMHDALTSLPNRALLFDHIEHDIQLAHRANQEISLMVIDLDRFKEVNDTLGHHIGDKFLVEVGARFSACLRETDTVARLGGDEFSILLPNMGRKDAKTIANKIIDSLKEPIKVDEFELPCSASIGISSYPVDGENAQTLLQHADVAMYLAKQNQSGFEFYDIEHDQYSIKRLALVNELKIAIEKDQLELVYQPIVNVTERSLFCVESLLRWQHPEHGYISPELIIDLAEQTGLIIPLTYYVLEKAMQQQQQWTKTGLTLTISVNLSMYNLRDPELVNHIQKYLDLYMPKENRLILEVTESAMMSNPHQVIDILGKLEAMNVTIAIDDFGTGFSSLAYLKKLPVQVIKIDRSFINDLENDSNDQAIVHATLSLGHELGLRVIAEGVETHAVQTMLKEYRCDAIQGFYISPPIKPGELLAWLKSTYSELNSIRSQK